MSDVKCRLRDSHGCDPCKICNKTVHVYYNSLNYCDICWGIKPEEAKGPDKRKNPIPGGKKNNVDFGC